MKRTITMRMLGAVLASAGLLVATGPLRPVHGARRERSGGRAQV